LLNLWSTGNISCPFYLFPSMKRYDEIEIKLQIPNRRRLKERIEALGFTESIPRVHERNMLYDFPDRSLTTARCALRVRSAGAGHWLTFKGNPSRSQKYKVRQEIETAVSDGKQLSGILQALGLRPVFVYEKYRTTYTARSAPSRGKQPTLAFDETLAGDYVELEGPRTWIERVAAQLGFDESDYVTASYVSLLSTHNHASPGKPKTARAAPSTALGSIPPTRSARKKP
jgi:predicted adenylyl cyclase CyaB